ncbi:hypothetical protein NC651_009922 [Populus alba x Populus x berolinensis]|nr:hypothetical protein NC651_009922 [Populus alba x Populus x berolinensis]
MRVAAAAAARSRKGVSILLCVLVKGFVQFLAREVESVCRKKTAKISFGKWVFFLAEFLVFKMKANIWVISEGLTKNVTFPMKTQISTSLLSCTAITVREKERESESVCFSPICERSRERNERSKRGSKRNQAGKRSAVQCSVVKGRVEAQEAKTVTVCPLVLPLRFWSLCFRYPLLLEYVPIMLTLSKKECLLVATTNLDFGSHLVEEEMSLAATIDDKGARGAVIEAYK